MQNKLEIHYNHYEITWCFPPTNLHSRRQEAYIVEENGSRIELRLLIHQTMCQCDQTDSPLLQPGGHDTAHSILQGAVCIGCSQVALCFRLKEEVRDCYDFIKQAS